MGIQFTRRYKTKAIVDMVPMIDIVFQLVIFFMVATTFKTTTGMELELPKSNYLATISTTLLKITIIDANNILVGDLKTDISNFAQIIRKESKINTNQKKSVVIYGNKSMEYQLLIDIMDILRIEGYDSIDLALTKKLNL
ncbi:MAG: hypothetical protein A2Y34_03445 [Spirochaetes bacterium GWC1_27_15]|nr:MAG: hypothetical protein A2Z98_13725 [Spirochaetes bacterium GWB1_27_13]OHD25849.1 MAG: hypothetical protein A2Y34_03445 [Spirochaetes bacterium GWC1_27_15]